MRRLLAALLFCCFVYNIVGFYLIHYLQVNAVKKEIKASLKAGVPEDELHYFEFTAAEFEALQWEKPNKEFQFNRHFYDVVRRIERDGLVLVYCVDDTQEAALFQSLQAKIDSELDQQNKQGKAPYSKLVQLAKIIGEAPSNPQTNFMLAFNIIPYRSFTEIPLQGALSALLQPPQMVC